MRVLLYGSSQDLGPRLAASLGGHNIELARASTPEAAISSATTSRPDLVVMDVRLGFAQAAEAAHDIRKAVGPVPMILISSKVDARMERLAREYGAVPYMVAVGPSERTEGAGHEESMRASGGELGP